MTPRENLVGRFVFRSGDWSVQGLAAHEVSELLAANPGQSAEIFRIHRVCADGSMELVGVRRDAIDQRDCLLFTRTQAQEARKDYDDILAWCGQSPPPCRIELQLSQVSEPHSRHIVAMVFSAACGEAVAQWILRGVLQPGDQASGTSSALDGYESAFPQVILQQTLEPVGESG